MLLWISPEVTIECASLNFFKDFVAHNALKASTNSEAVLIKLRTMGR